LVAMMMLAFGLGLLFPLLLVFLQVANVLTPRALIAQWRYAIMAIFVVAAVITPSGDPVSLFALSIPMTVLYLVSVLIGLLIQRSRRRASVKAHGS
ncbi:MAG: twin-arginine translocase subunit TatC, partial [Actinobacteria bacterium]|nr:twin-arginine translocase subunit TatC [Actinomycetota bacterium]